jgi:hypothetical protein
LDSTRFRPDTAYTVTWLDPGGVPRPLNIYVYRVYQEFLVARVTMGAGALRRIGHEEILRIVEEHPASGAKQRHVPSVLLEEKFWRDRTELEHYASSPALGK